jgi:hypothetical protein
LNSIRATVLVGGFAFLAACATGSAASQLDSVECAALGKVRIGLAAVRNEELPADHAAPRIYEYYSKRAASELSLDAAAVEALVVDRAVALLEEDFEQSGDKGRPCIRHMLVQGEL